jgi:hypothetical protein
MTSEWLPRYNELRTQEALGDLFPRQYLMEAPYSSSSRLRKIGVTSNHQWFENRTDLNGTVSINPAQ